MVINCFPVQNHVPKRISHGHRVKIEVTMVFQRPNYSVWFIGDGNNHVTALATKVAKSKSALAEKQRHLRQELSEASTRD
jgi:hypothetical protein